MPLYFAYGANLNVEAMRARCPHSAPLGPARLMGYRLASMREGWLTVARAANGCVHGLLWDLALADVAPLDRFEGVAEGLYVKRPEPVLTRDGPKRALVYFGTNHGPGEPRAAYLAEVIAAAEAARLPPQAIEALRSLAADRRGRSD